MLFLYHNLSAEGRCAAVSQLGQLLIDVKAEQSTFLLVARVVVLLDYALRYFDEPSELLLRLVERHLLRQWSTDEEEEDDVDETPSTKLFSHTSTAVFYSFTTSTAPLSMSGLQLGMFMSCIDYDDLYTSLTSLVRRSSSLLIKQEDDNNQWIAAYVYASLWSLLDPRHGLSVPASFESVTTGDSTDRLMNALRIEFDEEGSETNKNAYVTRLNSFVTSWASSRLLGGTPATSTGITLTLSTDIDSFTWLTTTISGENEAVTTTFDDARLLAYHTALITRSVAGTSSSIKWTDDEIGELHNTVAAFVVVLVRLVRAYSHLYKRQLLKRAFTSEIRYEHVRKHRKNELLIVFLVPIRIQLEQKLIKHM